MSCEIKIGAQLVQEWQFKIFEKEAEIYLNTLKKEAIEVNKPHISNTLHRAVHTLSGITKTLGFNEVAKIGHPLEQLLNNLLVPNNVIVITSDIYNLIKDTVVALTTMVVLILEKKYPIFKYDNILYELSEKIRQTQISTTTDITTIIKKLIPYNVVDEIDQHIKTIFLEEATDILETMSRTLIKWIISNEKNIEYENRIKHTLHTLKGSARMAGYFRLGQLVHNIETIMNDSFIIGQYNIPEVAYFACNIMIDEIDHLNDPHKKSGLEQLLEHLAGHKPLKFGINNMVAGRIKSCDYQAVAPLQEKPVGFSIRCTQEAVAGADEESTDSILRVPSAKVDLLENQLFKNKMINLSVEASTKNIEQQLPEIVINTERLRQLLRDIDMQSETQMKSCQHNAIRPVKMFDTLEFDRFSRLQELTRMASEAMNDIKNSQLDIIKGIIDIKDAIAEAGVVSNDTQHALTSIRTVMLSSIKRRLDRLVRQSCRDAGKKAEFILEDEIDIDSKVLNKIILAIEHLVRNCIAHGIETPDHRIKIGKSENGIIRLGVSIKGNEIVFKLTDDGAGINREKVQQKARQEGIIKNNEEISQERADELIFNTGFSTSDKISTLAGRGIGMSVVKKEISEIGGHIKVNTKPGEGTIFEISVPSHMSFILMTVVNSGNAYYAIPSIFIKDVVITNKNNIETAYSSGIFKYNNLDCSFYGLSEINGQKNKISKNNVVLLISENTETIAIHIEAIVDEEKFPIKPLCKTIASIPGLMGATIAANGTPLLVINPIHIKLNTNRIYIKNKTKKTKDITVMAVDDSITVRQVTQKFLIHEGFNTIIAKDGLDALEKIKSHGHPDIILCDIEMPNMDGFQLVSHIRSEISQTIPIIIISSRSIEKYDAYALSLGVNQLIGKPYNEAELIESIKKFTGLI